VRHTHLPANLSTKFGLKIRTDRVKLTDLQFSI